MSMFRSKKLDITGFVSARILRDHTKRFVSSLHSTLPMLTKYRKVYAEFETQRYASPCLFRDDRQNLADIRSTVDHIRL